MSTWTADQLRTIAENYDLFVSPYREDGTTYGTPTRVWPLVVDGEVYARAAHGPESSWYQAAVAQEAGRVRVGDQSYEVSFEAVGSRTAAAIDRAYMQKYSTARPSSPCRAMDLPPRRSSSHRDDPSAVPVRHTAGAGVPQPV